MDQQRQKTEEDTLHNPGIVSHRCTRDSERAGEFSTQGQDMIKGCLCQFISDDVRSAVQFNERASVDEILDDVRVYLSKSTCPLILKRLDVIRYI